MIKQWSIICFCLTLVWGCAAKDGTQPGPDDVPGVLETLKEKAVAVTPVPAPGIHDDHTVLEDQMDSVTSKSDSPDAGETAAPVRVLPTLPVTMEMHDISLPVLLRTLARVADLDIMLTDNIKGQLKMVITDVPWDQAFKSVLDTFGLTWEWTGEILRVISVEDLEKQQALLLAKQNFENTVKKHQLALMAQEKAKARLEPLSTKIVKIHYADIKSLQKNLLQYLSLEQRDTGGGNDGAQTVATSPAPPLFSGNIMVDEYSNALIIHATRSEIKKVMPIIRRLDQPIRQVLIEAHIVEAEANTGKALGVQWGGLGTARTDDGKSISVGGNMTEFDSTLDEGYVPTDGNIVNLPTSTTSTGTGMTLGLLAQKAGDWVLYTQLMALEQEGKLNILSKPSITTLDHRKAVIKSGRNVPYQTVVNEDISIQWKEAVIKLEVTPHIVNDKIVRLEIITHKDELDFNNDVEGNPIVITKSAETNVMLFDGQTTVIGGLTKEKKSDTEKGVPGLRKAPGLGWLFKSIDDSREMEELLIFITPKILEGVTDLSRSP